jgi:hypothetical protein
MRFAGSTKPNRKFGLWGTRRFVALRKTAMVASFHAPPWVEQSRWMTEKKQILRLSRMELADATKLERKSGEAQWRDLRFQRLRW